MTSNNVFDNSSYTDMLKMVFVIREDLKMTKGEIITQCGHGAISAYERSKKYSPDYLKRWLKNGQVKEAVKVENENKMMDIRENATAIGVNYYIVQNDKRQKCNTVLVIGPAPNYMFESLTRSLKPL
ncbi:hypothetical protein fep_034 [Pigeonpox virus]|uniref:peptidyl-tRNA hydrolase n=1 Tax=Pigeonpox virus TaxID=10264 RepID=A0A068EGS2_9POXV|nr:hypothetical protein HM89_gp035 [Pigeonpox virus]AID46548.1 hypothetical protein fep_034 [Pigeonpox virus]WCL39989.1 hypothetical protein [Pigeonpox virus]WIK87357.1 hypothetical protein TDPV-059 [Oriental turtle dovepox virus]